MSCTTEQTPITIPPIFIGDTFDELAIALTEDADETELYEPLSDVEMVFTRTDTEWVSLTLTSGSGDITIDGTATQGTWRYTVDAFTVALAAGIYRWSITMTSTASRIKTWLFGTVEIKTR